MLVQLLALYFITTFSCKQEGFRLELLVSDSTIDMALKYSQIEESAFLLSLYDKVAK